MKGNENAEKSKVRRKRIENADSFVAGTKYNRNRSIAPKLPKKGLSNAVMHALAIVSGSCTVALLTGRTWGGMNRSELFMGGRV